MNSSDADVSNTATSGGESTGIGDQVIAAGRDLQSAAMSLAGASGEAIKGHASDLVDSAKDIASTAGMRLQETMESQKGVGADYVSNLAKAMDRAAGEFDQIPMAATYIRKAADQLTLASDTIRQGNLNDLVQRAQSFARNQPTAFLGLSLLAGFGAVRFFKSASAPLSSPSDNVGQ